MAIGARYLQVSHLIGEEVTVDYGGRVVKARLDRSCYRRCYPAIFPRQLFTASTCSLPAAQPPSLPPCGG